MLDIGWTELLVIAVVAIIVVGPKDLPRALRVVGQWTTKLKRMARDFQGQFTEAIREAELDAVQRDLESITKIDPLADVRAAAEKTGDDIRRDLEAAVPSGTPSSAAREPYPWEVAVGASPTPAPAAVTVPDPAPVAPAAAAVEPKP